MALEETIEGRDAPPRPPATAAEVAWVLIFLDGLLLGFSSLFWIVRGRFFDREFYESVTSGVWPVAAALAPSIERVAAAGVRLAGFVGATASILVMGIAATSFRRAEPWAWYVMLALPALATLDFALLAGYESVTPTSLAWDVAVFGLGVLGLALPYRSFFPKPLPEGQAAEPRPSHA